MSWMPVRNVSVMPPLGLKPLPAPVENFVRIPVWPRSGMGTGWMEALRQLASSPGPKSKKGALDLLWTTKDESYAGRWAFYSHEHHRPFVLGGWRFGDLALSLLRSAETGSSPDCLKIMAVLYELLQLFIRSQVVGDPASESWRVRSVALLDPKGATEHAPVQHATPKSLKPQSLDHKRQAFERPRGCHVVTKVRSAAKSGSAQAPFTSVRG